MRNLCLDLEKVGWLVGGWDDDEWNGINGEGKEREMKYYYVLMI